MKNYYEILEVDKNASQEVIEKAYKTLAKKYHPDLQQGAIQKQYAEKMKIINEAYDILSDNYKRSQYNEKLQSQQYVDYGTNQKQTYYEAYVQDMQNKVYKSRKKHDLKYYLKAIKIIAIAILGCFLIYQIPFVKIFFKNLYNENIVFQAIIDIFKNTFTATF